MSNGRGSARTTFGLPFTSTMPVPSPTTVGLPTTIGGAILDIGSQIIGKVLGGSGQVVLPGLGQGGLPTLQPVSTLLAGGKLGTRRRMNVLNPHALRRSMRRVQGFAKFARKTITFTRKVKMKKRRRS